MTSRSLQQKIGAQGEKWLTARIEEHPDWLARYLGEDYGIDIEAELTENGVRGEILKIQVKSTESAEQSAEGVKVVIDRKYVEYAESCRYPVILMHVDTRAKEAWYVWVQEWLLRMRGAGRLRQKQSSWTCLI